MAAETPCGPPWRLSRVPPFARRAQPGRSPSRSRSTSRKPYLAMHPHAPRGLPMPVILPRRSPPPSPLSLNPTVPPATLGCPHGRCCPHVDVHTSTSGCGLCSGTWSWRMTSLTLCQGLHGLVGWTAGARVARGAAEGPPRTSPRDDFCLPAHSPVNRGRAWGHRGRSMEVKG